MQTGHLTPTDQRDIPCHLGLYSAYKAGSRRRYGGTLRVVASSQVTVMQDGAQHYRAWLNHGKWRIPSQLFSFAQLLLKLYNCLYPNPHSLSLTFSHFHHSNSLPHSTVGKVRCVGHSSFLRVSQGNCLTKCQANQQNESQKNRF